MSIHVRQLSGTEVTDDRSLTVQDGLTDAEYLDIKAASHAAKGWVVTPVLGGFDAVKVRSGGVTCLREFRII